MSDQIGVVNAKISPIEITIGDDVTPEGDLQVTVMVSNEGVCDGSE